MSTQNFPELRTHFADLLRTAVATLTREAVTIVIERSKQAQHGDFACSVALQLAKSLRRSPREIATALITGLPASPYLEKAEVAGAGFINMFVRPEVKRAVVPHILSQAAEFGRGQPTVAESIHIEFVSANPTGPLHVGHGRGAAFGASLANVLETAGHKVTREYYVNDAGRQMDILAVSVWLRYLEICGVSVPFPPNAYQGDYVITMAQSLHAR